MKTDIIDLSKPRPNSLKEFMEQDFIEAIGEPASIQDAEFKIIYQNSSLLNTTGDYTDQYCYRAYNNRDSVCSDCPLDMSFRDGSVHKVTRSSHDGKMIYEITSSVLRDKTGKVSAGVEIIRDITERVQLEDEILQAKKNLESKVGERTLALKQANIKLKARVSELKKTEEALRESNEKYFRLFENESDAVMIIDPESYRIEDANRAALNLFGYSKEEFLSLSVKDISSEPDKTGITVEKIIASESGRLFVPERRFMRKSGSIFIGEIAAGSFYSGGGKKIIGSVRDITDRIRSEELLKNSESKLREQKKSLEQKNIALRELMEQVNIEKNKLKEDVAVNVEKTLLPLLSKLNLSDDSMKYKDLLKYHLDELASSFGRRIMNKSQTLTPKEIEICNMIKGGLTSKEICNILFISDLTVEKHRRNIRKKLGLSNKKINLSSYLHNI